MSMFLFFFFFGFLSCFLEPFKLEKVEAKTELNWLEMFAS
jgi:hypothetical protein